MSIFQNIENDLTWIKANILPESPYIPKGSKTQIDKDLEALCSSNIFSKSGADDSQDVKAKAPTPQPAPTVSSQIISIILKVVKVVTVVPWFIETCIEFKNERQKFRLFQQLADLKWSRLLNTDAVDTLIGAYNDPIEFRKRFESLILHFPESEVNNDVKKRLLTLLKKSDYSIALKGLKDHLYTQKFYTDYKGKITEPTGSGKASSSEAKADAIFKQTNELKSKKLVESWTRQLGTLKKISKEELSELLGFIEKNNPTEFREKLLKILAEKTVKFKKDDKNRRFVLEDFLWKDFYDATLRTSGENFFVYFSNYLQPLEFYETINSQLNRLLDVGKNIRARTLFLDPEEVEKTKELVEEFFKVSALIEKRLNKAICSDYILSPQLEYHFSSKIGEIKRKLRSMSNYGLIFQKALSERAESEHEHVGCGCHFSYKSGEDDPISAKKLRNPDLKKVATPKQVVNIVRDRLNLEKKLAEVMKKLSEAMKASTDGKPPISAADLTKLKNDKLFFESQIKAMKELEKGNDNLDLEKMKTFLVYTCSFGTGHNMATLAASKYIGKRNGHVTVADVSTDVGLKASSMYNMGKLFDQDWKSTDAFNFILKKQFYPFLRFERGIKDFFFNLFGFHWASSAQVRSAERETGFKQLIRNHLLKEMPDHIITTYHMDINPIMEVAEELGIPIIHIATDYDTKSVEPFSNSAPNNPYFKVILPGDSKEIIERTAPLKKEQCVVTSGPIRPEFFTPTDEETLKKMRRDRGLDDDTKIVICMSGGGGQFDPYPEALLHSETKQKVHIIAIAGGDKLYGDHINGTKDLKTVRSFSQDGREVLIRKSNKKSNHITVEVARDPVTGTDQTPYYIGASLLNKFFDLADAAKSKCGGVSLIELAYKRVPIICDRRISSMPDWEQYNAEVLVQYGMAVNSTDSDKFGEDLEKAIKLGKREHIEGFQKIRTDDVICRVLTQNILEAEKDKEYLKRKRSYQINNKLFSHIV